MAGFVRFRCGFGMGTGTKKPLRMAGARGDFVCNGIATYKTRLSALLKVAEIGEDLLAFEVAHVGFHIVPIGIAVGGGGKGD